MPRIHIPFEVSHPNLAARRREHLKPCTDAAGLVLARVIGLPVITFLGGLVIFLVLGLNEPTV